MARGQWQRFLLCAGIALASCCFTSPQAHCAPSEHLENSERSDRSDLDDKLDASEADAAIADDSPLNEYDGKLFTARFGFGFLTDYAAFAQSDASKQQLALYPRVILRDFRLLLKGKFKFLPRVSYTLGYMYDEPNDVWRFRQTGFMIDVPEASGQLFIGRTKEGFSTSKIMVGYFGWTSERAAINDALLPILADGIKWSGNISGHKFVYNIGWFTNALAQVKQSYVKNDNQVVGRLVWLPYGDTESKKVLHLAVEARHGAALDGGFQYKSKPEVYPAEQNAIDTENFSGTSSDTYGLEAYYRPNAFMFGSEYFFQKNYSLEAANPFFHGGEFFGAYLLTGEIREYNERGGFWEAIKPARPVFKGGPGAWELVLRNSYADLDSGTIEGGKFWRITPVVNWYMSENARMELSYGYGVLNRDGIVGDIQIFQYRLQITL